MTLRMRHTCQMHHTTLEEGLSHGQHRIVVDLGCIGTPVPDRGDCLMLVDAVRLLEWCRRDTSGGGQEGSRC